MEAISRKEEFSRHHRAFFDRCVELWLGFSSGHMGADLYQHHAGISNGRSMSGVATWNDHTNNGTFPAMNRKAFLGHVGDIAELVGKGTPIVEFGPTDTTIRLIEAVESAAYVPVDSSDGLLEFDRNLLGATSKFAIKPAAMDFFADNNPSVIDRPALGVLLGPTISNIPCPVPRTEPADELIRVFWESEASPSLRRAFSGVDGLQSEWRRG